MKALFVLGTLVASLGVLGCSSDTKTPSGPVDAGNVNDPTFSHVYKQIIVGRSCVQGQCHGGSAEGGLQMSTKEMAYAALVGVKAAGACPEGGTKLTPPQACGCGHTGKTRVVAGDPDNSLLVEKLSGHPSCGDPMPQDSAPLPANLLDMLRSWIQLGAQDN